MRFYAFIPREDGKAPLGTQNRLILQYARTRNAVKVAQTRLKTKEIAVFTFTNFYDNKTFRLVYNGTKHTNPQP